MNRSSGALCQSKAVGALLQHQQVRRQRPAGQLAIDQTRANGFEQLELEVYSDNSRAIHLYEKFGFERYGIQPRAFKLKDGSYRDEIIMVKML